MNRVFLAKIINLPSVAGMIDKALEWWNMFVALALSFVTEDVTRVWNGALWTMIVDIYGALTPVGYALCMMSFLMGLFRVCSDMVEQKKMEHLIKAIIRYILTYSAIANGLVIIKDILMIVQGCIGYVIGVASVDGMMYQMPSTVSSAISNGLTAEQILYFVLALLLFLLVLFYGFSLILTVVGRFIRLGIVAALMPIGLGWFGGDMTKDMGRAHFKTYLATCLEGLVLVVALCLSACLVDNFGIEFSRSDDKLRNVEHVYSVSLDSAQAKVYVTVENDYTSGLYSPGYYDYPTNVYQGYIVETNVADEDMVSVGNVKLYPDRVGDTYTFDFSGRGAGKIFDAYDDFNDYLTYDSVASVITTITIKDDDTVGYVLEWMLVIAFNIVLFVNIVKGMDNFTSNLIKGG